MASMIEMKGAEYVVRWPHNLARREGLAVAYVGEALEALGIPRVEESAFFASERDGRPIKEIGDLTPEQATTVIARLRQIKAEIREAGKGHCYSCGLPLMADGDCRTCGEQI